MFGEGGGEGTGNDCGANLFVGSLRRRGGGVEEGFYPKKVEC